MGASEQAEMLSLGVWVLENCFYHTSISMMKDIDCVIPKRYRVLLGSVTITDYFWHIITWLRWQDTARQSLSHTVDLVYSWPCCHYSRSLTAICVHWPQRRSPLAVGEYQLLTPSCLHHIFVSSEDGSAHPVCPEDVVTIHSQTERMHWLILQNHLQTPKQIEKNHLFVEMLNLKSSLPFFFKKISLWD